MGGGFSQAENPSSLGGCNRWMKRKRRRYNRLATVLQVLSLDVRWYDGFHSVHVKYCDEVEGHRLQKSQTELLQEVVKSINQTL